MQGVTKRYGSTEALRGVDLRVHQGEIVSVLGPNGAGKTTAIAIMLGLREASSGEVSLFGMRPGSRAARSRVGAMLQDSGIPDALTVRELLGLFRRYYPYGLPVEELLDRADLRGKQNAQVRSLSGGQKQRLYFALAIAGDPDLVFLDEPTTAMDVETRRAFWEQVQGFAELGKTILFSTHHLEEADLVATRIVVIHEGRVLAEGTPREIKRLVADKTVRLKTDAPIDELRAAPGVQHAERADGHTNNHTVVYTHEPEALLATLFSAGRRVEDLTVTDTDLEAAFVSLTGRTKEMAA
jgi:ABC-2 type transport system ATP-binding protein